MRTEQDDPMDGIPDLIVQIDIDDGITAAVSEWVIIKKRNLFYGELRLETNFTVYCGVFLS